MNLPKPPEGYFWRIYRDDLGSLYVSRRRKRWVGSYLVHRATVPNIIGLTFEDRIERAARAILRNAADEVREQTLLGHHS